MYRPTSSFTAVVLAGDRGPGDWVARAANVSCKALTPVGGTPMVLRVLNALDEAREIEGIILCGPAKSSINQEKRLRALIDSGQVKWLENHATPSSSTY